MESRRSTNKPVEVKELLEKIPELNSCYNVLSKIGEGSFSKVYKATKKRPKTTDLYALKCITSSTDPKRIAAELKYMMKVGGKNHVMGLSNCEIVRGNAILVMPYFQHSNFYEYVETLTFVEISNYMTALLTALEWVHENGIIHRDVKPSNFLYNRVADRYALVDFGLAQNVTPSKSNSNGSIVVKSSCNNVPNDSNCTKNSSENSKNSQKVQNESNRNFKRNLDQALDSADLEPTLTAKKLCFDVEDISETISFLQPLGTSNRINVTVLPPGSDAIKKPTTILHKKVLFKENAKTKTESSTIIVPEEPRRLIATAAPLISLPTTSISVPNSTRTSSCQCFGKKTVCNTCLSKPQEYAPRAGTPGFRPPEVLIKYPYQTTAVDIWAAGVIFISLLSRRYPFFTNCDDMMALAEIACVLGLNRVKKAALRMGKVITIQTEYQAKDLHTLCHSLRDHLSTANTTKAKKETIPSTAVNLLYRLLDPNPVSRITAAQALKHPFITKKSLVKSPRMKL